MNRISRIKETLSALNPHHLEVIDFSEAHVGHYHSNETHTHLKLIIAAKGLEGISKVEQHKTINKLLNDEFNKGLHALTIEIRNT